MSFTDQKREEIKKYIFRKISKDDAELIPKTMDSFGISITTVKRYLKEAEAEKWIETDENSGCGYRLVEKCFGETVSMAGENLEEDRLYEEYIAKYLEGCNSRAIQIWQYACAEMLNNAIEHSQGRVIKIKVYTNVLYTKVVIADDGIGVFQSLQNYMKEHGWDNPTTEDALIELYKGKITSKEENHSGEGIFFTSKMVDDFCIWSDGTIYHWGGESGTKVTHSHLLAYASRLQKNGTMVVMNLENETKRKIAEVFNMYTDMDEGFVKTNIPIKEVCFNSEPVARSQARRICNRLESFKEVVLDFHDVEFVGQGFADEIFRVYAAAHPQVVLYPVHFLPDVERMIRHVGRGKLPENIKFPQNIKTP